jgi:hypothetical protein
MALKAKAAPTPNGANTTPKTELHAQAADAATAPPPAAAASAGGQPETLHDARQARPHSPAPGPAAAAPAHHAGQLHALPVVPPVEKPDPALRSFWARLPMPRRHELMRVTRRELFERIRGSYCSRCFGLFKFRHEELKT